MEAGTVEFIGKIHFNVAGTGARAALKARLGKPSLSLAPPDHIKAQ